MKILIFVLFVFSSLSISAQQVKDTNAKLAALKREKNPTILRQKIKKLENGTVDEMALLIQYYNKDNVKKAAITKALLKKYPQTQNARLLRLTSFLKIKGIPAMEAHLQSMIKDYPNVNLDMEKSLLSSAYAEVPNSAKVLSFTNTMQDPIFKVRAVQMAVDLMGAIDNTMALDLATKELEQAKRIRDQTALSKPLKVDPQDTYNDYINTYGKLLFKAGKNEEAYEYTAEAFKRIKNRDDDNELKENYALLASSLGGKYEEALPILTNAVKEGKFDKRYIDEVKKGYQSLNPGKDANAYILNLKQYFVEKVKNQIKKIAIDETAPDFFVTDVTGKKVTLADFRGKTIVLDFWATWCGPCVASFPAMQIAVNKYANDPNVKFLFIHTWENDPNPLADATAFLNKRNYKFNLYMDPRNPTTEHSAAADAFKLDGIPAKFVIDPNGRIRFKISGFEGKDEAAAEEIIQMVELARKTS